VIAKVLFLSWPGCKLRKILSRLKSQTRAKTNSLPTLGVKRYKLRANTASDFPTSSAQATPALKSLEEARGFLFHPEASLLVSTTGRAVWQKYWQSPLLVEIISLPQLRNSEYGVLKVPLFPVMVPS
jgi:hypothetical protein